jgi:hypothetical protein
MSPDWSLQWMADNSPIAAEKLHALGLVTFNWNRCEKSTFWLFSTIIGLPEELCWALTHEMGDITTCETIGALMKLKNFHPKAIETIGNALEVHNICRQNRNQLTHFEVHSLGINDLRLMRKSKKPDAMRPYHFSAELDDLRRVAGEIDQLDNRLWILTVIMESHDPTKPAPWPAKLPVPTLLWTPPPQSPAKQKPPLQPSRASRRKEALKKHGKA